MAEVATGTLGERVARVLLVQSSSAQRSEIAAALRAAGFEVVEVATGLGGIEVATACRPDLLLVDQHLPDLDGAEVATKLRQLGLEELPIVAMGSPAQRGVALSAGCDGTIASPPDLALLPSQVREFLAGKRDRLRRGDEKRYLKALSQSLVEKLEAKVRELTATTERQRRVDEFKTAFMQAISHELSTPLTPLAGYLRILQSGKLGPLNERQRKVVESMIQSAERLAHTIDNLSDFATLETGNYRMRPSAVDLGELLSRVVEESQLTVAKPKRVHLTLLAPKKPVRLVADPDRLSQAVANLLEHAINASPHGGEVLVEVVEQEGRVLVAVYDQGAGLPPEDQERIFEPFYQGRAAQHVIATGLGLPVARRIAEAHGGRLWVESPPKAQPELERHFTGAKYILELPVGSAT